MFKKVIFAVNGVLILTLLVLSIDAQAVPIQFTGEAWVAEHIEHGKNTGDWYLIIVPESIKIDKNSVKIDTIKLDKSKDVLDFSALTQAEKILWFDIEDIGTLDAMAYNDDDNKKLDFIFKAKKKNYVGTAQYDKFDNPTSFVPQPMTLLLVGSGLIGLAAFSRKKFKKT